MTNVFKTLHRAELHLLRAIAASNQKEIYGWVEHFTQHFPPIISKYLDIIAESLIDPIHKIDLLVGNGISTPGQLVVRPEIVHSKVLNDQDLAKKIVGEKRSTGSNKNKTILLYSKKFHHNFVSSQEVTSPVIKNICKHFECIICYPKSSPADEVHKSLGTYVEINDDTSISEFKSIMKVKDINPGIVIFFTPNNKLREELNNTKILDLFSDGIHTRGSRAPDYAVSLTSEKRLRFPNHQPFYLTQANCSITPPPTGPKRLYTPKINHTSKKPGVILVHSVDYLSLIFAH